MNQATSLPRNVATQGTSWDCRECVLLSERELGKMYVPAHIRSVEQIPRNETGKIDRLRLAQQMGGEHP